MKKNLLFVAMLSLLVVGCDLFYGLMGIREYEVMYYSNGADSGYPPDLQSYAPGTEIVVASANSLSRSDFSFGGWNTESDGSGTSYLPGDILVMPARNVNLFAQWVDTTIGSSTITFDANGGIGAMADLTLGTDETVTLPAIAFTRDGYGFVGWNTELDGTGDSYADESSFTMGTTDVVLFAQWAAFSSFFDDFEDGTLSGDPSWIDGGTDSYSISVTTVLDDHVLRIPRGSDYGTAQTSVDFDFENTDFVLEFETTYFGDSLGRPIVQFYDDSGNYIFRWYADTWNNSLYVNLYKFNPATQTHDITEICSVPYSSNSNHTYRIEKTDNTIILYEDGIEMCQGDICSDLFSEYNDRATILELRAHGSGPSSGVYYDDVSFSTQ